jgi:hypothetical protein
MYSVARTTINLLNAQPGSGESLSVLSWGMYYENVSTLVDTPIYLSTATVSISSNWTPEKLNTRTSDVSGNYNNTGTPVGKRLMSFAIGTYNHFLFRCHPRYPPIVFGSGSGEAVTTQQTNSDTNVLTFSLGKVRRLTGLTVKRRTSKPGYFARYGNETHFHKKTGSGAFEITSAPHFDNDVTWIDPSAWRNGSTQNEAWEMNLFGSEAPAAPIPNTNLFPNQSVKRAALF